MALKIKQRQRGSTNPKSGENDRAEKPLIILTRQDREHSHIWNRKKLNINTEKLPRLKKNQKI
jgi:hypothetical protein